MIRKTNAGHWIIHEDTHIGKWVEDEGRLDHDQNTLPILRKLVAPGFVVVDVGANIGDHTIAYSDWVGSAGTVLAFECNPEALECLGLNMKGRGNVQIFDVALWSEKGSLKLHRDNNVGASHVTNDPHSGTIRAVTLDSYHLPRLDFMKIDAEGCEAEILKGSVETLKRCRPILCLEVNNGALKRFEDFCSDFGYDEDSRKAYSTWQACLEMTENLERIFDADQIKILAEIR